MRRIGIDLADTMITFFPLPTHLRWVTGLIYGTNKALFENGQNQQYNLELMPILAYANNDPMGASEASRLDLNYGHKELCIEIYIDIYRVKKFQMLPNCGNFCLNVLLC